MHGVCHAGLAAGSTADVEGCMLGLLQSQPKLLTPIKQHLASGGQRYRAKLALSVSQALELDPNDALLLASCCELLHNASLIHDDIQDRDLERRGQPALWVLYGSELAICAGDLLISAAYGALGRLNRPQRTGQLLQLVHQRVAETISGQVLDLQPTRGSQADYLQTATQKTGGLFSLALELPLIYGDLAQFSADGRQAATAFARGYQILDDITDHIQDSTTQNLVNLLQSQGYPRTALWRARKLAMLSFQQAAQIADHMPRQCGALLSSTASDLSAKLNEQYNG